MSDDPWPPSAETEARKPIPSACLAARTVLIALLLLGCDQPAQTVSPRSTAPGTPKTDHLVKAVEFIRRLDEFERHQAVLQATFQLNRWIGEQSMPPGWQPDNMVRTLPREIREGPEVDRLDTTQFFVEDVDAVIEASWMRDVSQWVSGRRDSSPLSEDLAQQAAALGGAGGDQLTIAFRLFDWTIRNVELEPLLEYPADQVTVGTKASDTRSVPGPRLRMPGPGYQLQPWQVLLYGRGDSLLRSRVFILLARQQGIPVVMLAFPGQTTPPRPRPWFAAALIQRQLYLFDTQLGVPIPGPAGQGIATLENVLDDPAILNALSVGDEFKYEVAARDLRSIIALIDGSAFSLSLRAKLMEESLSGQDRLRLTVDATGFQQQLATCRGIEEVALWALPYEADWFRAAIVSGIKTDKALDAEQYLKYGAFQIRTAIVRARYAHFQGRFDNVGDVKGAKTLYLESRMPNKQIEQLDTSEEVQESFGVGKEKGEHEMSFRTRIAGTKLMVSQTKLHASYWLGLAHYDTDRPAASVEWLNRSLGLETGGTWSGGARYNLGRAYEAQGKIEEARELYLSDQSSQKHGNVLRARLLRKHLKE